MLRSFALRSVTLPSLIASLALASSVTACSDSDDTPEETPPAESTLAAEVQALLPDSEREANDILLVHGAWADGSSWSGVIGELQDAGFSVQAVQLREQSVEDDAALVRHAIDDVGGPLVAAGHSYGGYVISVASPGAEHVLALVYVAACAADEDQTQAQLPMPYPTTPAIPNLVVDDQGNAIIDPHAFVQYFASDLPE